MVAGSSATEVEESRKAKTAMKRRRGIGWPDEKFAEGMKRVPSTKYGVLSTMSTLTAF
jgi:hypothetical protein